ncbi:MAG: (Fe-S)-binding protein [Dermatophilaceae bacterium]|nr:(Fe-S)-binding protein [Actinomycetales bacterium]MBP8879764.1 (Fe-S)-binding protein [Dermatophilaceae bacterium]MBP9919559.1 (Fe-S)-binding protein [Dermatophilaceae bacterium]
MSPATSTRPKVALFATCYNDTVWPGTPIATVKVLERLGCEVVFPEAQTCCGQIFTNTGYADEAIPLVRGFVDTFGGYDYVVAPSGSCVGAIREQHHDLAERAGDAALVRRVDTVVPKVYDISEFIIDVLGVTDVGAYFPHRVTFHPTCHSIRVAHVGDRPQRLLQSVRGLTFVELPQATECCGFGGTFSVKNPDVSISMASDKARHVRETGAEVLVAGDNMCLMNIGGVLRRQRAGVRIMHLAEILASTEEDPA